MTAEMNNRGSDILYHAEKGKVLPVTSHKAPEGESRYTSALL
jgi:hypothetical protein